MTSGKRRVVRATSWLVAGRVYAAICALFATWLLTEYLSLADLGRFSFYLAVLARRPTDGEFARGLKHLRDVTNRTEAVEDLLWVLVNSTEFLTKR